MIHKVFCISNSSTKISSTPKPTLDLCGKFNEILNSKTTKLFLAHPIISPELSCCTVKMCGFPRHNKYFERVRNADKNEYYWWCVSKSCDRLRKTQKSRLGKINCKTIAIICVTLEAKGKLAVCIESQKKECKVETNFLFADMAQIFHSEMCI